MFNLYKISIKVRQYVILIVCWLGFANADLCAQVFQATGMVRDARNQPLPGVNVLVKGTTRGTTSDAEGKFTVEAAKGNVLVASMIGFQTKEVTVENTNALVIELSEEAKVIYGTVDNLPLMKLRERVDVFMNNLLSNKSRLVQLLAYWDQRPNRARPPSQACAAPAHPAALRWPPESSRRLSRQKLSQGCGPTPP